MFHAIVTAHSTNLTGYSKFNVTGWGAKYGKVVDVERSHAVITRYAHANTLFVKVGDIATISGDYDSWLGGRLDWTAFALRGDLTGQYGKCCIYLSSALTANKS